ncbi:hypothetical protein [Deinococcus sp. Marseille-Q6407]|uniref:hypothetical protein n=1 Tax=Deinococcus sp. Marseille-Q6407 TaxID=2969223 RepID=UPI0021BEF28F|nr:hypothetical protein [Deinococcus sp. Marseille-Q6407]
MLGKRRPSPLVILVLSLLLGVLTAALAYRAASAGSWLPAVLWGLLTVWLVADALRAFGWTKHGRSLNPPAQATQRPAPPTAPQPGAPLDPAHNTAVNNPLLHSPLSHNAAPQQENGDHAASRPQSTDRLD